MGNLRGWLGEKKTTFRLWLSLHAKTYRRFHHLIIPSHNGTTQIDHLLLSSYGLFIIESKNRKGWIFGSEDDKVWTQVLFGMKYTFQNPLHQTYRQKKVLAEFLDIHENIIFPIVYFNGDCCFQTELPANVIQARPGRFIKGFTRQLLDPMELDRLVKLLSHHQKMSKLTGRDHIHSLYKRHSSRTKCPKCGSKLIERQAKKGPHVGSIFLGCTSYPKCRFTRKM